MILQTKIMLLQSKTVKQSPLLLTSTHANSNLMHGKEGVPFYLESTKHIALFFSMSTYDIHSMWYEWSQKPEPPCAPHQASLWVGQMFPAVLYNSQLTSMAVSSHHPPGHCELSTLGEEAVGRFSKRKH